MILPDINFLVYAHRSDSPLHKKAHARLKALATDVAPFALCSLVCSGFIRIVTNHRIFVEPTSLTQAISFLEALLQRRNCRIVEPGELHYKIFFTLLEESKATANLVSDAYLTAIAVEHGCTLLTHDTDFLKFPRLNVEKF